MYLINNSVLQYSIGRDGSTLIVQILRKLCGNVNKEHSDGLNQLDWLINNGNLVVTTLRNPVDCFFSHFRTAYPEQFSCLVEERLGKFKKSQIRLLRLDSHRDFFKDRYKIFCSVCKNNKDSTLQLKYEKFYNDYEYIFDKFEKFFSVKINDELRHEIKHDTSLKKNLKLQTGLKEFAEHDMVSGIHGDHIAYPEICGYRKLLAPNVISWAERSFESEIKYWELYDETI